MFYSFDQIELNSNKIAISSNPFIYIHVYSFLHFCFMLHKNGDRSRVIIWPLNAGYFCKRIESIKTYKIRPFNSTKHDNCVKLASWNTRHSLGIFSSLNIELHLSFQSLSIATLVRILLLPSTVDSFKMFF